MPKFGPKLIFLVNLGQAMQAYSMPCCGSVGGCGARAVSGKTPIYFIYRNVWRINASIILQLSLSLINIEWAPGTSAKIGIRCYCIFAKKGEHALLNLSNDVNITKN